MCLGASLTAILAPIHFYHPSYFTQRQKMISTLFFKVLARACNKNKCPLARDAQSGLFCMEVIRPPFAELHRRDI